VTLGGPRSPRELVPPMRTRAPPARTGRAPCASLPVGLPVDCGWEAGETRALISAVEAGRDWGRVLTSDRDLVSAHDRKGGLVDRLGQHQAVWLRLLLSPLVTPAAPRRESRCARARPGLRRRRISIRTPVTQAGLPPPRSPGRRAPAARSMTALGVRSERPLARRVDRPPTHIWLPGAIPCPITWASVNLAGNTDYPRRDRRRVR
jgi:hypothetical protein